MDQKPVAEKALKGSSYGGTINRSQAVAVGLMEPALNLSSIEDAKTKVFR
jgi:hypothetical protein